MKHRRWSAGLLVWGLALGAWGCAAKDPFAQLGPAQQIVATSVQWMGGYNQWNNVRYVRAKVLVTTHEEGRAYANLLSGTIYPSARRIQASAQTGQGSWQAVAYPDGRCNLSSKGFQAEPQVRNSACGALSILAQRLPGPLELLRAGVQVRSAEPARFAGQDLVKVVARMSEGVDMAYYFAASTGELRFVIAGEGAKATATAYTYQMLPNGLAFPAKIRIVETSESALLTTRPVLEADFSDISVSAGWWVFPWPGG